MPQVNLLPWREQARKAKIKRFGFQTILALMAALICIIILHMYYTGLLDRQQRRVDYLQNQLNTEQLELSNFDKQVSEQQDTEQQLLGIKTLRNRNYRLIHLLNELAKAVPENVYLEKVAYQNHLLTISGRSQSNTEITLFMNNISHSPVFKQPELTDITGKGTDTGEIRRFSIKVFQHDDE